MHTIKEQYIVSLQKNKKQGIYKYAYEGQHKAASPL